MLPFIVLVCVYVVLAWSLVTQLVMGLEDGLIALLNFIHILLI